MDLFVTQEQQKDTQECARFESLKGRGRALKGGYRKGIHYGGPLAKSSRTK